MHTKLWTKPYSLVDELKSPFLSESSDVFLHHDRLNKLFYYNIPTTATWNKSNCILKRKELILDILYLFQQDGGDSTKMKLVWYNIIIVVSYLQLSKQHLLGNLEDNVKFYTRGSNTIYEILIIECLDST